MKKIIYSLTFICATSILLSGCGDSGAYDTADAFLSASWKELSSNDAEYEFMKKQPMYAQIRDCFERKLSDNGWGSSEHEEFMEATNGTANPAKIDRYAYTEEELVNKFGALLAIGNGCEYR